MERGGRIQIAAASRRPRRKAPRAQGARLVESDDRNLDASFPDLLGPLGTQVRLGCHELPIPGFL